MPPSSSFGALTATADTITSDFDGHFATKLDRLLAGFRVQYMFEFVLGKEILPRREYAY
ncbi:hypothetical protein GGF31_002689 [Allomyces arbusculus]|nr:hypothetical protein GGF31_002689 [Allomyces arbusculus]